MGGGDRAQYRDVRIANNDIEIADGCGNVFGVLFGSGPPKNLRPRDGNVDGG